MVTTSNLVNFINEHSNKPFQWGKFDCVTFLLSYIKFLTKVDLSDCVNCKWTSKKSALGFLVKNGGSFESIFDKHIKGVHVPTIQDVQTGDIVIVEQEGGWHTATIFCNNRLAMVVEDLGVKMVPLSYGHIIKIVRVL